MKIIIIGGGWSGCAAAITAKKAGADVTLYERTDLLLGLGNVGGIMRNNGRYTATEEAIALGASELFELTDKYSRSEEHTSELQSRQYLVCRLLLEKKNNNADCKRHSNFNSLK